MHHYCIGWCWHTNERQSSYRKILAQIIAPLDGQSVERVRSLFGWIAFTRRPLKRLELLSAITFSSSDHSVPHLVPDFILKVCGPLVEERANAAVSFIHSTVKECVIKNNNTFSNRLTEFPDSSSQIQAICH
jgi:hypothetical protein